MKRQISKNLSTNIIYIIITIISTILLTPYIITKVGIDNYGLIALSISFITMLGIFTSSLSSSSARYVSIEYHGGNITSANTSLTNSITVSLIIIITMLALLLAFESSLINIINVTNDNKADFESLLFLTITSGLLTTISSQISLGCFVKNRLDIINLINMTGKLFQITVIIILFETLNPNIIYFGISQLIMTITIIILSYYFSKKMTTELRPSPNLINLAVARKIVNLGTWNTVNEVGALLYINISYVLVNVYLGTRDAGEYAIIMQWYLVLSLLGGAVANVFQPIIYKDIGEKKIDLLSEKLKFGIKYTTLILSVPVALVSAFSHEILKIWANIDNIQTANIMTLLIIPWLISIGVRPLFSLFNGMRKVKIPAFITLLMGLINVAIFMVLVKFLNYGLISIAIALIISLFLKNLFFTTIYSAYIINSKKTTFIKSLIPGSLSCLAIFALIKLLKTQVQIDNISIMLLISLTVSILATIVYWHVFCHNTEKNIIYNFIQKTRIYAK